MNTMRCMFFNATLLCSIWAVKTDVVVVQDTGSRIQAHRAKQDMRLEKIKDVLFEVAYKQTKDTYTKEEQNFDKKRLMQPLHDLTREAILFTLERHTALYFSSALCASILGIGSASANMYKLYDYFFSTHHITKKDCIIINTLWLPGALLFGLLSYAEKHQISNTAEIDNAFTEHNDTYIIADQDLLDLPIACFDNIIDIIETHEARSYMSHTALKSSIQDYKNAIEAHIKTCRA